MFTYIQIEYARFQNKYMHKEIAHNTTVPSKIATNEKGRFIYLLGRFSTAAVRGMSPRTRIEETWPDLYEWRARRNHTRQWNATSAPFALSCLTSRWVCLILAKRGRKKPLFRQVIRIVWSPLNKRRGGPIKDCSALKRECKVWPYDTDTSFPNKNANCSARLLFLDTQTSSFC